MIVRRPAVPPGVAVVSSVDDVLEWLRALRLACAFGPPTKSAAPDPQREVQRGSGEHDHHDHEIECPVPLGVEYFG